MQPQQLMARQTINAMAAKTTVSSIFAVLVFPIQRPNIVPLKIPPIILPTNAVAGAASPLSATSNVMSIVSNVGKTKAVTKASQLNLAVGDAESFASVDANGRFELSGFI